MNYRIYNKSKLIKYTGCQCFKDCSCYLDYPKKVLELTIEFEYKGKLRSRSLNVNKITNGSVENFISGIKNNISKNSGINLIKE